MKNACSSWMTESRSSDGGSSWSGAPELRADEVAGAVALRPERIPVVEVVARGEGGRAAGQEFARVDAAWALDQLLLGLLLRLQALLGDLELRLLLLFCELLGLELELLRLVLGFLLVLVLLGLRALVL